MFLRICGWSLSQHFLFLGDFGTHHTFLTNDVDCKNLSLPRLESNISHFRNRWEMLILSQNFLLKNFLFKKVAVFVWDLRLGLQTVWIHSMESYGFMEGPCLGSRAGAWRRKMCRWSGAIRISSTGLVKQLFGQDDRPDLEIILQRPKTSKIIPKTRKSNCDFVWFSYDLKLSLLDFSYASHVILLGFHLTLSDFWSDFMRFSFDFVWFSFDSTWL